MKENPPEVEAELDRRFAEAELRLQTYELEKQKLVEACYVEQVEPIVTEILTQTDWVDRISQFFESDIWRKFHALVFHFDSSEMPASHGIDLSEMSLRHLNFEKFTGKCSALSIIVSIYISNYFTRIRFFCFCVVNCRVGITFF